MLKTMFAEKAFINDPAEVYLPEINFQDIQPANEPFDGNAFSGSAANRHNAELTLLQTALVNGGESGAPLVNVMGKLNASFNNAAGKKKNGQDRGQDMMMSLVMQQILRNLEDQLEAIDADLNTLADIRQRMEDGTFDPLRNDEDLKMLQQIDAQMTAEKWDSMAMHEQTDWLEDHAERLNAERAETVNNIEIVSNPDAEIPASNNSFHNPQFEAAALIIEERTGQEFDRHNITDRDKVELLKVMNESIEAQANTETALTDIANNAGISNISTTNNAMLSSFLNSTIS